MTRKLTRRHVLAASTAAAAGSFITPVRAAPPEPTRVTPALIEAAKKEGKFSWDTSVDLALGEKVARAFEARYPGITMKVERSGAERNFQRIGLQFAACYRRQRTRFHRHAGLCRSTFETKGNVGLRKRHAAGRLERELAKWNADGSKTATIAAVQARMQQVCSTIPDAESAAKAACVGFL